ncbi:hypothetical protein, partial [Micromonospora olivasterospora]
MEVDAEPRTPVPPPAAPAPPEIVDSPAWNDFFRQVLVGAGGQVAETLGRPTVGIDDVRHYLAVQLGLIVQRTDFRERHGLPDLSLERLQQALDSRGSSVPGLTHVLPHLVSEAFGINFAVSGSETVRHDQGVGTGRGLPRRPTGWGPAAAHGGFDSGEFGSGSMVQETGDRAGLPAEVADGWTAGDPPPLTGGHTKTIKLGPDGRLPFEVGGKRPIFRLYVSQEATLWFGYRADGPHAGEPAASIKLGSPEGRKGGSYWQWLDPAPTEKDLGRLRAYEPRIVHADGWTEGDPPQLTDGYTKRLKFDPRGRLRVTVGGKRPYFGDAAANKDATLVLGYGTDGPRAGKPAALIKLGSLEGRTGGPFWQWLDRAPTEKDLGRLRTYEPQTVHADEWTERGERGLPQLADGYDKRVGLNCRGQLPFELNGKRPSAGMAAKKRKARVWLGYRTDRPDGRELAALVEVEELDDRDGGPFWRWLNVVPTEGDLNTLKTYEYRPVNAGEWTERTERGLPQLTGGYDKTVKLNQYGRLPFNLNGKRPPVGADAADQTARVWLGYRTDRPDGRELAALVEVEELDGRDGGPFWRWLDRAPTEKDLDILRTYEPSTDEYRTVHAGGWTAGDPPQLTGGYDKTVELDRRGRLRVTVGGKRQSVGTEFARKEVTLRFGYRKDGSPESEKDGSPESQPAALVKVGRLKGRKGDSFWRWLNPAPIKGELDRLQTDWTAGWTKGDPPELTGGNTRTLKLGPDGRLPVGVGGKRPRFRAAAGQEVRVWFGYRTDRRPEGEPAALIEVASLGDQKDQDGGPFWRWLESARTEDDLDKLRTHESRPVHAGEWTAGKPPQLTGGGTATLQLLTGWLPVEVGGERQFVGAAAAGQEATVRFGYRTDRRPEGELAALVKVGRLEGRDDSGPFWRWLDPAPAKEDLARLQTYEVWTEEDAPQLTGGDTKTIKLGPEGRLPFEVGGKRPVFSAAAGQEVTVWFGYRTDESHVGEPAALIEAESLNGRDGGPFWRWLESARTEDDLNTLRTHEPRPVYLDSWTAGSAPQLTGGYDKTIEISHNILPFSLNDKRPFVGAAAAGRRATVRFGYRTDEPHEGELAALIEVVSLGDQKDQDGVGPFWRWLDPAPTPADLDRLKDYKSRAVQADEWTAGDPPQLTGGYIRTVQLNSRAQLPFTVSKKRPFVGVAAAGQEATVRFGFRTDEPHEGELAALIKVGRLEGRDGRSFWRWLDPAPTPADLDRLKDYKSNTVHAGEWTAGDPPELTGGYIKRLPVSPRAQLPFTVSEKTHVGPPTPRKRPFVGAAAAGQEATVWFGYRTDESHVGEPAALVMVGSLKGWEGGPFWRWLDPAPTEDDLKRLRIYEYRSRGGVAGAGPRPVNAGGGTAGDPPQLTGGSSGNAAVVAPASTGSVGMAYRAARD